MKNMLIAIACTLPFGIAVADEAPLLETTGSATLIQLNEAELDAVKGGRRYGGDHCFACYFNNTAVVTQLNLSLASFGVSQYNDSYVKQNNN